MKDKQRIAFVWLRAKIVDGRLGKYAAERSLLEQPYIKDPKKSVGQHIKEIISQLGEETSCKCFKLTGP